MSWTYDPTALAANPFMQVRLLIGDTDTNDKQLQDEEITFTLTLGGNDIISGAIQCCRQLAAKYARLPDISIDAFRVSNKALASGYEDLADKLEKNRTQIAGALGVPYLGGTSLSDMLGVLEDPDRNPSRFSIGMDQYPGTPQTPTWSPDWQDPTS